MAITLTALAVLAARMKRRRVMDTDALLNRIEKIVEKPAAAAAPVSVAPINWGVARAQVTRASKRIKRHHAPNGVHEGVLIAQAPSAKAKRRKAKKAVTPKRKRHLAAKRAAKTRAENKAIRVKAARKGARTKAAKKERYAKAAAKRKRKHTTRRKHGKK